PGSPSGYRAPVTPSVTISVLPPTAELTTGHRHAMPSSRLFCSPSDRDVDSTHPPDRAATLYRRGIWCRATLGNRRTRSSRPAALTAWWNRWVYGLTLTSLTTHRAKDRPCSAIMRPTRSSSMKFLFQSSRPTHRRTGWGGTSPRGTEGRGRKRLVSTAL